MTPNDQAAQASGEEEDLEWVRQAIGHMSYDQKNLIRTALTENPAGTHALCAEIASDPSVRSPIAVLLYGIKQGKHNAKPRTSPRTKPRVTAPLDRAHALFTGKLKDLEDTDWPQDAKIEFAIDYALDHCGAYGQTLLDTETQLRSELHAPRWDGQGDTPPDPAKYTAHRAAMQEAHRAQPEQDPDDEPVVFDDDPAPRR